MKCSATQRQMKVFLTHICPKSMFDLNFSIFSTKKRKLFLGAMLLIAKTVQVVGMYSRAQKFCGFNVYIS